MFKPLRKGKLLKSRPSPTLPTGWSSEGDMSYWQKMAFALALVAGLCGGAWAQVWGSRATNQNRDSHAARQTDSRVWRNNNQTRAAQDRGWARDGAAVRDRDWHDRNHSNYPYRTGQVYVPRTGGWGTNPNGTYSPYPTQRTGGWGSTYPNGTNYPYPTQRTSGWGYPNGTYYPYPTGGYGYPSTGGWGYGVPGGYGGYGVPGGYGGYGGPGGYGGYGAPGGYGYGGGAAYQTGYMDGVNAARIDRRSNRGYGAGRGGLYKHADHGYNHSYGNKGAYQQAYRNGYLAGYRNGFGRG